MQTGQCKLELNKALEFAEELLAAAKDAKDPTMLLTCNARGTILLQLGESATQHLKKALAVFDPGNPIPRSWRHRE